MNVRDVRMVQRGERLRLAGEAGEAFGIVGEDIGQDFDRDVAIELRVPGFVDLAHAAGADGGGYFVRTESSARREWHSRGSLHGLHSCCRARERSRVSVREKAGDP